MRGIIINEECSPAHSAIALATAAGCSTGSAWLACGITTTVAFSFNVLLHFRRRWRAGAEGSSSPLQVEHGRMADRPPRRARGGLGGLAVQRRQFRLPAFQPRARIVAGGKKGAAQGIEAQCFGLGAVGGDVQRPGQRRHRRWRWPRPASPRRAPVADGRGPPRAPHSGHRRGRRRWRGRRRAGRMVAATSCASTCKVRSFISPRLAPKPRGCGRSTRMPRAASCSATASRSSLPRCDEGSNTMASPSPSACRRRSRRSAFRPPAAARGCAPPALLKQHRWSA